MAKNNKRKQLDQPSQSIAQAPKRAKTLPSTEMIDFTELKAWIAVQEEYQLCTGKPAPVTTAQVKAIGELRLSVSLEKAIAGRDWVGLLCQYTNARVTLGISANFTANSSANPNVTWTCVCCFQQFEEPKMVKFPSPEFGFVPLGIAQVLGQPSFARKKDARQYAAKCCIDWLVSLNRMPDPRSSGMPKTQKAPKVDPIEALLLSLSTTSKAPSSGVHAVGQPPPSSQLASPTSKDLIVSGDSMNVYDDRIPTAQRVQEMCRRLGIQAPKYELISDGNVKNPLWSGYPDFGADKDQVPREVGVIQNIFPKKLAKQMIAEEVLSFLLQKEAERDAQYAAMVAAPHQSLAPRD